MLKYGNAAALAADRGAHDPVGWAALLALTYLIGRSLILRTARPTQCEQRFERSRPTFGVTKVPFLVPHENLREGSGSEVDFSRHARKADHREHSAAEPQPKRV